MSKIKQIAIYLVFFITVTLFLCYVYRFVLMFNNKLVSQYIKEEATQYGENAKTVETILHNTVADIKGNAKTVKSIKVAAEKTGIEKERILVNTAIAQALNNNFLIKQK